MAGIYIHIPFCDKACPYCDFYFLVSKNRLPQYIEALLKELQMRSPQIKDAVETIYFGGGTPSVLNEKHINEVLAAVYKHYNVASGVEITFELNPEHVNLALSKMYLKAGINRLSFGVQSYRDSELKLLGRQHSAEKAISSLKTVREAGFKNLSLDLIMGIPNQNMVDWQYNLEQALKFKPEHLSIYSLTIEEGTPLEHSIKTGKIKAPSADFQAELYKYSYSTLCAAGYDAYEISNYALPSYRSKHNSSYWKGIAYLGFGPSAHSFLNSNRFFNPPDLKSYLEKIEGNQLPIVQEERDEKNILNETILINLRQKEGLSLAHIQSSFGLSAMTDLHKRAQTFIDQDLILEKDGNLFLSLEGRLLADTIAMEFFADDES